MQPTIPQHLAQRERERNNYRLRNFVAKAVVALGVICLGVACAALTVLLVEAFATASANADAYSIRGAY